MTPRIHPRLPPDQRVPTSHRADMMVNYRNEELEPG